MGEHWIDEFCRRAETEFPHVSKVGRYLFFGWLSFGAALTTAATLRGWGLSKAFTVTTVMPVSLIVFLILRDQSRLWDMARTAARRDQSTETER